MIISTPIINLEILLEDGFVTAISETKQKPNAATSELSGPEKLVAEQFEKYLNGELKIFDIEYKLNGSDLQLAVWKELAKVPYGETISYTELAAKSGYASAIRAVATAVGQNPIPVVIPCHRVVRKSGEVGEYSLGGVEVKKFLLGLESNNISNLIDQNIEEYRNKLKSEGFPLIYIWEDEANTVYEEHSHKGKVSFYVLEGEVSFSGGITATVRSGERIDVPINVLHSAKVGAAGCKYLVAQDLDSDT